MLTGKTRYRVGWFRKLIIQVEEMYNNADYRDPHDMGQTFPRFRDATVEDLQELQDRKE